MANNSNKFSPQIIMLDFILYKTFHWCFIRGEIQYSLHGRRWCQGISNKIPAYSNESMRNIEYLDHLLNKMLYRVMNVKQQIKDRLLSDEKTLSGKGRAYNQLWILRWLIKLSCVWFNSSFILKKLSCSNDYHDQKMDLISKLSIINKTTLKKIYHNFSSQINLRYEYKKKLNVLFRFSNWYLDVNVNISKFRILFM